MFSSCSRALCRASQDFLSSPVLSPTWLREFPRLALFWWLCQCWGALVRYLWSVPEWEFDFLKIIIRWGYGFGGGGNNTEVPFSLYCVKAIDFVTRLSTRLSTADWLRPPGRSGSVRFLHYKPIHFSPFPCWTLWKEVTVHSPHLKQLHFAFLRAEYLHKLLGILLHGKSGFPLPFTYLIIYLLKYRLMGIYFLLWVIIQHYYILLL